MVLCLGIKKLNVWYYLLKRKIESLIVFELAKLKPEAS